MLEFGLLNVAIVAAYLIGNLYLGFVMSQRIHTANEYYIGDKSAPWWAIGISVMATYVSALSFLGGPAWAYTDGMAALAIHVNYTLVIFICVSIFVPFFYNSGVVSIYDYLNKRFGIISQTIMSGLFIITITISAASILTATGIVVTFATGIESQYAIIIMTVIVLVYTLMGGMNAVIWTDVLQGIILIIGAMIIFGFLLIKVGALPDAFAFLEAKDKLNPINTDFDLSIAPTIWAGVVAMTVYHITVYGANQMMVQRVLAAKTIGDAKKSYLFMGYVAFILYFMFIFIGALLYVFYEAKPFYQTNAIILNFAESLAIPGLLGIIGAAILSASMSSTSSAFNSLATVTISDFYKLFYKSEASDEHYLKASRIVTVMWAVVIVPIALAFVESTGSILETMASVLSYLVGAKFAMFGMGFFSKHVSERGLIIGVIAGFVVVYISARGVPVLGIEDPNIAWPWYAVIGSVINITVAWIASITLDGFKTEWHRYSVPGQQIMFAEEEKSISEDGWYLVPGRIEKPVWGLLGMFALIIIFMMWFGTLAP